jgi:tetratricopeptide (TPR) repeat protein
MIRINKDGTEDYINRNIAELVKMAKRDKYEEFRDVIYSMAAQMELERGNVQHANDFLVLASRYKTGNTLASNRAYLQLAELAFARKAYQQSASFYDSLNASDMSPVERDRIAERKEVLKRVLTQINSITRQDSLQRIAALPEEERTTFIKKLVRQLRKQQGLKDETTLISGSVVSNPFPNPFADRQSKGEWYFYNNNLKANGITSFKQVWGNRPNVDNWRRFSDVTAQLKNTLQNSGRDNTAVISTANLPPTYDVLLNNLPVSPEQIIASNDSIKTALFTLGDIYIHDMEDYEAAQKVYEDIKRRFGDNALSAEALYNLHLSYREKGSVAQAEETKKLLLNKFPADRFATLIRTGIDPLSNRPATDVTKTYEEVYDLYLEGRFPEAKEAKIRADSMYKTNYWSPQLLYIESVYHIQRREDSVAKQLLATLISQNAGTPLGDRAQNLLQVLNRRAQIEDELKRLHITRPTEDSLFVEPMPIAPTVQKNNAVVATKKDIPLNKPIIKKPVQDSAFKTPAPVKTNALFTFDANANHSVVVVLNKVDVVFVNEAKNAFNRHNKEKFYNQPLDTRIVSANDSIKLVLIGNFTNAAGAIDYIQKTKPLAASEILPWLKRDKFSFSIITSKNLEAVLNNKDFASYQKFIDQNLPVKF